MVDLTPTGQIAEAASKGLALVKDGKGGDGLVDQTLVDARRMASGKSLSEEKVRKMPAWFARHASDKKPGWDKAGEETPGYVAFLLWGGETASDWATRKVAQLDKTERNLTEDNGMAALDTEMPEPGEDTTVDAVVDVADCVEELSEALADSYQLRARAEGAHWNVKGPAFGAFHELFGEIRDDLADAIDPLAEQLLKLDLDAPSTLSEFIARSTITAEPISSDDPQALALDLRDMNDMVLKSLGDAYDCASELCDLAGLANLLADRIDMHRKWRWQLTRSISNPSEPKTEAPMNPPEASEADEIVEASAPVRAQWKRNIPEQASEDHTVNYRRAVIEGRERLVADLQNVEIRESGAGSNFFTLRGHAAIFSHVSEELGGFREILEPGCFRDALDTSLIHLLWNHDARMPLASTDSGTLEVQEDELGLRVWARIPNDLSYARDIRTLFENGIAKGMSFAFTLPADGSGETWSRMDDGTPLRTINRMAEIFDVAPVTRGAYSAPGFSMRSVIDNALESGRLSGGSPVAQANPVDETVTPSHDAAVTVEQAKALAVRKANFDRRLRLARARTR